MAVDRVKRFGSFPVKVGPVRYKVAAAQGLTHDGVEVQGLCQITEATILINTDHPVDHQRSTLFHEVLHAVDQVYGIGLSEHQVRLLEVGVLSALDDNPRILGFGHEKTAKPGGGSRS